ncbi:MAG: hypothetical protein EOP59_08625 [Sphingomonadales bacterium]|nr:MAG: hypothetical protein EOP59_08625 [Sphingomonadales bacterium]
MPQSLSFSVNPRRLAVLRDYTCRRDRRARSVLHLSYLKGRRIALASLSGSALIPEAKVLAWTIDALRLRWIDDQGRARHLKIRSNTVKGGRPTLAAFAEAIGRAEIRKL